MPEDPATSPTAEDAAKQARADARAQAMLHPVYRFSLSWKAPDGQMFVGHFAHKAPTVGEQMAIDQAYHRHLAVAGGSLQPRAAELAVMVIHLDATLVERPPWAKDLRAMTYLDPLYAVAEEATAHCRAFCQSAGGEDDGGGVAGGAGRPAAPLVEPEVRAAP